MKDKKNDIRSTFNDGEYAHIEPKVINRFQVIFNNDYSDLHSYVVKSTQRPVYSGQNNCGTISMILYDPINPSTTNILMTNSRMGRDIISYTLNMLDPLGEVVESWKIRANIIQIDYGQLDYGTYLRSISPTDLIEPMKITLTLSVIESILLF